MASTWLDDHQRRTSASLTRCVKPLKYGALTNTLELEFEPTLQKEECIRRIAAYIEVFGWLVIITFGNSFVIWNKQCTVDMINITAVIRCSSYATTESTPVRS